jgi:hypothetical protein
VIAEAEVLLNQFVPYTIMTLAVVIGGGSLLLFGTFLLIGPIYHHLECPEFQVLFWDDYLSSSSFSTVE